MQACQVNEDRQDETVKRHKGQHRQPQGQLYKEEHDQRDRHHEREEGLQLWQYQDIEGHQALREFLKYKPFPLKENLDKSLVPARTLFNKLFDGVRSLFAGDKLIIVDDAHTGVRYAQANPQVGVFRQTCLVPAAHLLHQVAPHKDRVASERRHPQARKKVQGRLEPEEVFQHIEEAEPLSIVVHELHTTLYYVYLLIEHGSVDDIQDVGVRLILGIEDGHHVAARYL